MKIGTTYKIIVSVDGRNITFTGKIVEEDDTTFLTFIDKFGVTLSYNKSRIVYIEELK